MAHSLVVNIHQGRTFDVYVGRKGRGFDGRWGNPFILGTDGTREEVIEKYRVWLPQQPALMRELPKLRGKVLGCFCAPLPCHGDVIAEMANRGAHEGQASLFGGAE